MKKLIVVVALLLTACDNSPKWEVNQKLRREIFNECLNNLPAGPNATMYNDWAEVVSECGQQAYYMSLTPGGK